ncbi:MAG: hypothetical protein HC844_18525 [Tabrizicola sp.]|nr:hypothetical protein [Tabrizicola sp.]
MGGRLRPICHSLALALVATAAQAQIIPTGSPAADILLSRAVSEHRTFLTCSSLDPQTHALITANWQRDVTAATAILTAGNVAAEAITAFTATAQPENLLPASDTPYADVRQFCEAHADWQATYGQLNFTLLELTLPGALE